MHVIDHEPSCWYLLREDSDLFLDVNSGSSFVGASVFIQMNSEEVERYRILGRPYISQLAQMVDAYGPRGEYRERYPGSEQEQKAHEAVRAWIKEKGIRIS